MLKQSSYYWPWDYVGWYCPIADGVPVFVDA